MLHWHSSKQGGGEGALPSSPVHLHLKICPPVSKLPENAPQNLSESASENTPEIRGAWFSDANVAPYIEAL